VNRVAGPGFGGESASPELADHERRKCGNSASVL